MTIQKLTNYGNYHKLKTKKRKRVNANNSQIGLESTKIINIENAQLVKSIYLYIVVFRIIQ